jgi:hypothetical protein
MHYRFPALLTPILFYCLLAMIALICASHDNQMSRGEKSASSNALGNQLASAQSTASNETAYNETLYMTVNTDRPKYAIGHDVTILGNIFDRLGHNISRAVILQVSHEGERPQTVVSINAKDGSFRYRAPIMELPGKYNITAGLDANQVKAWTSFDIIKPPIPTLFIVTAIVSLILFILTLICPLLIRNGNGLRQSRDPSEEVDSKKKETNSDVDSKKKETNSDVDSKKKETNSDVDSKKKETNSNHIEERSLYIPSILRFFSLSLMVLAPYTLFIYADLEFGVNSPVGLVIKEPLDKKEPLSHWIINIGGTSRDNYSSGLQIPFYVFAFGIAGGYLRYLYKAAYKSEHGKSRVPRTRNEFMEETIGELSEILLSPFLAIAAWFLLSVAGEPNVYTVSAVSFTVGLATKDIVDRLILFLRTNLASGENTQEIDKKRAKNVEESNK